MLWLKSFHIIAMVAWFAGLLYLPRLFVYHAQARDAISHQRFIIMERRLLLGIMTPAAIATLFTGTWLWQGYGFTGHWLLLKLGLVGLVIIHHLWCHRCVCRFAHNQNTHSHRFYRGMNELPFVYLVAIIILVVVKPW